MPKEVKPGGLESHPSWVGNCIKLSVFRCESDHLAMYPEDGDGLEVLYLNISDRAAILQGEVRTSEKFVARSSKLKAHSPGAAQLQGSHLACICK